MPALKEKVQANKSETQQFVNRAPYEEIALRAYYLYIERGAVDGHDVSDRLQAERGLASKTTPSTRVAKA